MRRAAFVVAGFFALVGCTGSLGEGSSLEKGSGTTSGNGNGTGSGTGGDVNVTNSNTGDGCTDCTEESYGVGTQNPFDPATHDSDNVGKDPDGALVLDPANSSIPGIIWIANTNLGTVTKVDTTTYAILGRYAIGSVDPSRTSVNGAGDVFVGNRSGNTLTKVSAAGKDCPDTNGDNQITTSSGFNDVLPFGQDDCMRWDVKVPNTPHVRGVAAQDVIVSDPQPDDPDKTKTERYVWVGGTAHRTVYKFDGDTGKLLIQTESPSNVYGLALDGNGQLWISGRTDGNSNMLGRVDTTKCKDQQSCDGAEVCTRTCNGNACTCNPGCQVGCDNAIKERIIMPNDLYGVTVDFKQRVWTGGSQILRYNPKAADAQKLSVLSGTGFIHGIAADAKGSVWGAGGGKVVRVDAETLQKVDIGVSSKGMAVDKDGKIWAIENGANANVITPGSNNLNDFTTTPGAVGGLGKCYTYSDMTGLQLALATNKPGYYREVFQGCPGGGAKWYDLVWDADLPAGTSATFRGRTANSKADLEQAKWVVLAKLPLQQPPVSISKAFDNAGIPMGNLFELEVELKGVVQNDQLVSPKIKSYAVTHQCPVVPD